MSNHRLMGDMFTGCMALSKRYIACMEAMVALSISTSDETSDDLSSSKGRPRQRKGLIRLVRERYYT